MLAWAADQKRALLITVTRVPEMAVQAQATRMGVLNRPGSIVLAGRLSPRTVNELPTIISRSMELTTMNHSSGQLEHFPTRTPLLSSKSQPVFHPRKSCGLPAPLSH